MATDDTPRRARWSSPCSGRPAWGRPRSRSRSPSGCARDGEDPVAVSADALQVYDGLEILTGAATPQEQQRLEHRLVGFLPGRRAVQRRRLRAPRPRRDRRPARAGPAADRRRRHRPVPARRAGRARPPPARATRRSATAAVRSCRRTVRRRCTTSSQRRAPAAAAAHRAHRRQRIIRALELLDAGHEPPARRSSCGPPTPATRRCSPALTMEREALYERIDARVDAMVAAGARDEVERRGRRRVAPPPARRSASRSCSTATSTP